MAAPLYGHINCEAGPPTNPQQPFEAARTDESFREETNDMENVVPQGWHTVTPRLVAHDAAKLVRFLKDAFGACGEYRADMPSVITIGDSIIMVSEAEMRTATRAFLYLYVPDTDETYRRALDAGAVSVEEPAETPYGDRRAMVTDPGGNDWQIATYAQSSSPKR